MAIASLILFFYCRRRRRKNQHGAGIVEENGSNASNSPDVMKDKHMFTKLIESPGSHNKSVSLSDQDIQFVPIFDQRVDPNQFYMHWEKAGSRASLQDNEDYSRKVLRVANPDKNNPVP